MRDSFVFYKSFYEALKSVPKKHRLEIYDAVFAYAFESSEPSLSGVPRALWELIRPQLDASERRYENAKKGAEYGKKGGRPRKTEVQEKPLKGYETKTLNVNVNENVNDNENVNVNASASTQSSSDHYLEVEDYYRNYCLAKGYQARANFTERFLSYRHSKDWQADVRSWADKDAETDNMKRSSGTRSGSSKIQNFTPSSTDWDDLAFQIMSNQKTSPPDYLHPVGGSGLL